jgi:hypothetical protein
VLEQQSGERVASHQVALIADGSPRHQLQDGAGAPIESVGSVAAFCR